MEQSTQRVQTMEDYTSIYERPKQTFGRPKGTCQFTDEEITEKAIIKSNNYYDANDARERERERNSTHNIIHKQRVMFKTRFSLLGVLTCLVSV